MSPEAASPLSQPRRFGSSAGQPLTRRDGLLKVTGRATYAADNHPEGMLYAVTTVSSIARGKVKALDIAAAKSHPGVVEVMTPANRPPLAHDPEEKIPPFGFRVEVLQDDSVRYAQQPIALVIGETLEAATEGAALLRPQYETEPVRATMESGVPFEPGAVGVGSPARTVFGDIEAGFAAASHITESDYATPAQYHNAMEPHAVVAQWDGDRLTLDMPNQAMAVSCASYGTFFDVPAENVLIRSPFLGGGFGSKAILNGPQILAILAARMVKRPVKLVLTRAQMYGPVGHRGETRQTLRLGTDGQGRFTAIRHRALCATSSFDDFLEPAANASLPLYASSAILVEHQGVRLDTGTPGPMRAPGEASGSAALEAAIDEAAEACGMDPLEFRLVNYAETEPVTGKPFSSKALRDCYAEGGSASAGREGRSRRAGCATTTAFLSAGAWAQRSFLARISRPPPAPRSAPTEPRWSKPPAPTWAKAHGRRCRRSPLSCSACISIRSSSAPEPRTFRTAASPAAQGIPQARGSRCATPASTRWRSSPNSPPPIPPHRSSEPAMPARDGRLHHRDDESRSQSFADILARAGRSEVTGSAKAARHPSVAESRALYSHGAVFAEVKVDPDLGQIRVTRLVGAFAAGRIINPHLARSQYLGGMIWGLSFALQEEAITDRRTGRIMNADLAEYHVPVNADAPSVEAILIHEDDPHINALGVKGVGEIGVTGTVGAIANAVWHATGVRVRRYPIHIEEVVMAA